MLFVLIIITFSFITFIAFFGNTREREEEKEKKKFKEIMGYDYK